jgi:hypothetical protein
MGEFQVATGGMISRCANTDVGFESVRPLHSASSTIFPHVEDSEDEDIGIGYFVANFIVSHQNSAYFAGLEFHQPSSQMRVSGNSFRARDQPANDAKRGRAVNGTQKFVKANQV